MDHGRHGKLIARHRKAVATMRNLVEIEAAGGTVPKAYADACIKEVGDAFDELYSFEHPSLDVGSER